MSNECRRRAADKDVERLCFHILKILKHRPQTQQNSMDDERLQTGQIERTLFNPKLTPKVSGKIVP